MKVFLMGCILVLISIILIMMIKWPKTIEISDIAPKDCSSKNKWLQLQNEGGKYVRVENGRIKLKIVKWKD